VGGGRNLPERKAKSAWSKNKGKEKWTKTPKEVGYETRGWTIDEGTVPNSDGG